MSIEPKVVLIKSKEEADKILNNGTSSLIFKEEYADITRYISKKCKNKLKKQYSLKGKTNYFRWISFTLFVRSSSSNDECSISETC